MDTRDKDIDRGHAEPSGSVDRTQAQAKHVEEVSTVLPGEDAERFDAQVATARSDSPDTVATPTRANLGGEPKVIPVVEERVVVDRRSVETGRVLVRRHVEEERVIIERPVRETSVEVDRREINEFIEAVPAVRTEKDTEGNEVVIIPVVEEVLVVQKRLMLKEEVRLTRRGSERLQRKVETVHRQDVEVSREEAPPRAHEQEANPGARGHDAI